MGLILEGGGPAAELRFGTGSGFVSVCPADERCSHDRSSRNRGMRVLHAGNYNIRAIGVTKSATLKIDLHANQERLASLAVIEEERREAAANANAQPANCTSEIQLKDDGVPGDPRRKAWFENNLVTPCVLSIYAFDVFSGASYVSVVVMKRNIQGEEQLPELEVFTSDGRAACHRRDRTDNICDINVSNVPISPGVWRFQLRGDPAKFVAQVVVGVGLALTHEAQVESINNLIDQRREERKVEDAMRLAQQQREQSSATIESRPSSPAETRAELSTTRTTSCAGETHNHRGETLYLSAIQTVAARSLVGRWVGRDTNDRSDGRLVVLNADGTGQSGSQIFRWYLLTDCGGKPRDWANEGSLWAFNGAVLFVVENSSVREHIGQRYTAGIILHRDGRLVMTPGMVKE